MSLHYVLAVSFCGLTDLIVWTTFQYLDTQVVALTNRSDLLINNTLINSRKKSLQFALANNCIFKSKFPIYLCPVRVFSLRNKVNKCKNIQSYKLICFLINYLESELLNFCEAKKHYKILAL